MIVQEYLRRLLKDKARLRKWKRIMIALSCIVVVCTVYALSLPAQTLACDKEEHTHTAECYDENNELICEKEEHTHNEDCNKQYEVNEQEEVVKDEPETQNNDEQVSQESEEEETTTTTETTTETTKQPFDLSLDANKDKIKSIDVYYKDANDKWQSLNSGTADPNSTELYLKVDFDKIDTKNLLEQNNGILVYSLPKFMRDFEKAGNGNLLAGERNIGTIEIENNQVRITLKKDYLNELVTNSSNQLDGSFYVKGQIDLTKINNTDGKATLVVGKKTVILDYGKECIEKFGSVTIDKQISNVDKVNNYLTYTVTVTAGKDGCKGLYVVDKFTSNANLVSYAGNISSTETTLTSNDNKKDPFEMPIEASHGKIYKADIPDATTKIPKPGASEIKNPCIVWNIGNMGPNESRMLTYYVKLNDKESLKDKPIDNSASLYSKGSTDTYDKGSEKASFTPTIVYSSFEKYVDGTIKRNSDGSYTIPFKSLISIKKDESNYTIKNLQFYDYLKHNMNTEIDADLLQYIHFDRNSFKLYMNNNNEPVDSSQYNIKWSTKTDNTGFQEWDDKVNFRSFVLSGNKDNPINLSPGESCYITYNVIVKPEAFAKIHTDTLHAFNRFIAHADNVDKRDDFAGGFEAWNSIANIKTYEWNAKQVEKIATTTPKTETMSGDRFIYENNAIQKDSTSNTSFTIPEGSYKYTVETNKTLNDFNVNEVTMTDTLTSNHMKYVGYMKVEALEAESISSDLNKEKNDTYTLNSHYKTVDTKWVKIDNQNSFSLKPYDLGWTDKNYAYRFTYYAKPDNLDTFTETKVKNKFTLEGVVKKGNGTFKFNQEDVSRETTLTIKGNLNLNANKQSWYYKEPNTDSNTWTNGELYWVVDIGGTQINKDMVFRDLIKTGDGITNSILREGSLVGIYKGTLPEGKKISDYKDIEDLKNKSGLTPINDKFISQLNGTNELLLTAKDDIQLGNEKVYMIIKSEPSELPSPTNNRDTKTYKNSIYIKEDGEYVSEIPAEKTLYTSPKVLKELGQVFKYDGIVTTLKIGADKKDNGDADPSKIDTKLLDNSKGIFISWAFKVNYDGQLSGDYDVIDDIPDGMEFSYMRVKWHGDDASQVTSKTIENFDSSTWEQEYNDSKNDNKNSEHTIYYVSKDKKRTMIRLGDFKPMSTRDNNSVDVQVVCRITDPQVLLGAQSNDFTNKVTLQKNGKDIATSSSKVPVQLGDTDKNIDKEIAKKNGQKLDFEINTNQLGQTLPTNDDGGLTLVDKLGDNLRLDMTSVKVYKNNNVELTDCIKSYQNNILEISRIPNDVPIKIRYTVTVNMKPGDAVNIANTAYWKGYSENGGDTVQESYSYSVSGIIQTSSVVNFKLTKLDQNNLDTVLRGATFKIEKCTFDESGNMTTSDISTETTNENGIITEQLQYDTLYRITETQAPYGYVLDDKPIYILDVKDKDNYVNTVKQKIKDGELNILYKQENFDLDVMNHKGEITVVKKFINDAAGKLTKPVSGIYRFGLYDDKNKLDEKAIIYDAGDTQDKSVKFENLDLDKTYYVYELDDQDKPITDTSKEVTINTMNYQVVYEKNGITLSSEKNSETIEVTNKSRTKILPSTGSMGTLIYRLLGATLVVVSVICLSNINKNKKKKIGERDETN
ncbi:prealbumin-like fold domain-containing protein [Holdemanella biformis]|uniref:prealbumin-like fold domain-containing protein n=3 Tax=Holdemanella biformis TaxID=1735 RepID=UPI00266CB8F0|nr:prealbumin-like fold domain-containing protein [Holdemanella biformis]